MKKHIPNLFTLANLLMGCIAVTFAFQNKLEWVPYLVFAAAAFDFWDGAVARMLKVSSHIGKELDSLADMVSFGLVPGTVMYQLIRMSEGINDSTTFSYLATGGFLITLLSALRLAIFNVDERQSDDFIGVPTPASTLFFVSLIFLALNPDFPYHDILFNKFVLLGITAIFSYLLVAELRIFAFKFKNFSWDDNKLRFSFMAISLALLSLFGFSSISVIILIYIAMAIADNLINPKN